MKLLVPYFTIDPAPDNEKVLIPKIEKGEFVILHGPRASGKSTRVYRLKSQLEKEYHVL